MGIRRGAARGGAQSDVARSFIGVCIRTQTGAGRADARLLRDFDDASRSDARGRSSGTPRAILAARCPRARGI